MAKAFFSNYVLINLVEVAWALSSISTYKVICNISKIEYKKSLMSEDCLELFNDHKLFKLNLMTVIGIIFLGFVSKYQFQMLYDCFNAIFNVVWHGHISLKNKCGIVQFKMKLWRYSFIWCVAERTLWQRDKNKNVDMAFPRHFLLGLAILQ